MRRSRRPIIYLALAGTGLVTALPVQLLAWIGLHRFSSVRWIAVAALVAECCWVFAGRPRPWSINRQVPQSWGHDHGPWKAALRYGFRLGVGPATILNSWCWWCGAILASQSLRLSVYFVISFVTVRSALTVQLPGDPTDGLMLSRRMTAIRAADPVSKYSVLAITAVATMIGLAG